VGRRRREPAARLNRLAPIALLVAVAAVAGFGVWRRKQAVVPAPAELLPYQAKVSDLPSAEHQRYDEVQKAIRAAEQQRTATGAWPAVFLAQPGLTWTRRASQLYVNYLGIPAEPDRPRWLVLIIEPPKEGIRDPAPPEDDEHHTLGDGTPIHLGVWTAPNAGPVPEVVLPFPAAEGWTQRMRGP
jgi:hypothetical protein